MRINVTFRHTEPTDALKKYAEEKINKLEKFLDRPVEAHVILSVEKIRHIAEVIITADGLAPITSKESTNDLYSAIDKVTDKMERQLKKEKGRRKTRKSSRTIRTSNPGPESPVPEVPEYAPAGGEEDSLPEIVPSDLMLPKPMAVEDAAMELVSGKAPLVVFRNAATMEVCVLHRNSDGTLGLVEPSRA